MVSQMKLNLGSSSWRHISTRSSYGMLTTAIHSSRSSMEINSGKRGRYAERCWSTSSVVGAIVATCSFVIWRPSRSKKCMKGTRHDTPTTCEISANHSKRDTC
ncbi:unnamed protein product [Sphacelaria rigidula]